MVHAPRHHYLNVALPVPLPSLFDYRPVAGAPLPRPGVRVRVSFGRRKLVGVVAGTSSKSQVPESRILPVIEVLDDGEPILDEEQLGLLIWCSNYYRHPVGEVLMAAVPPPLRRSSGAIPPPRLNWTLTDSGRAELENPPGRGRLQRELLIMAASAPLSGSEMGHWNRGWKKVLERVVEKGWVASSAAAVPVARPVPGPRLTPEQSSACKAITSGLGQFQCHLLDGVTGSGKTEIYLRLCAEVLAGGRQALVLVPEIGLTPQLIRRFAERLGIEPAVYHSGLSAGQRMETWADARSGYARLLLGTRSALFLPLPEPGLIIMDESHDASFKQMEGFRFSARDVAVKRASTMAVPAVLGTATPSLETLNNALLGRYAWHRLRQRATGAKAPSWRVVDLKQQPLNGGLSSHALDSVGETLEKGEQALVFLNRRGYAPVMLCHECGWHASCPRCDSNMTWHRGDRVLVCHHCDHRNPVPRFCPECRADALQGAGEGTQQLEQVLAERFPGVPLHRFDRDSVARKGEFEALVNKVRDGEPCLLIGTQMLAKGHHFPMVTKVVIVNADQALYSGDFRALERLGQLLTQVSGRAGREQRPGEVILQTHHPEHPLLGELMSLGYESFARRLLKEREQAGLPPFRFQAVLRAEAASRDAVTAFLENAARRFRPDQARLFGAFPAQMERRGGRIRWYLLLQADSRSGLQKALDQWLPAVRELKEARSVRWTLDVDPQEF